MTKAKLIEAIQTKEEELYNEFKEHEKCYGVDSVITNHSCTKWNTIYTLMEHLGIKDKMLNGIK